MIKTQVALKSLGFIEALHNTAVDGQFSTSIGDKARARTIFPPPSIDDQEFVGSKILQVLANSRAALAKAAGTSHVLYAPPSTGKTTALQYFVTVMLAQYNTPALMISENLGAADGDYLQCMAAALSIRDGREDREWLVSLVNGMLPRSGETLQHAPVLVLDEFNSAGEQRQNIRFADAFARYIHGKTISVLFVTQNESVARELCALNKWQKIGPLPGMTVPDRVGLRADPEQPETYVVPPDEYKWKYMGWNKESLVRLIRKRYRFSKKFAKDNFDWLDGVTTPTVAIDLASSRLDRDGVCGYHHPPGFFDGV